MKHLFGEALLAAIISVSTVLAVPTYGEECNLTIDLGPDPVRMLYPFPRVEPQSDRIIWTSRGLDYVVEGSPDGRRDAYVERVVVTWDEYKGLQLLKTNIQSIGLGINASSEAECQGDTCRRPAGIYRLRLVYLTRKPPFWHRATVHICHAYSRSFELPEETWKRYKHRQTLPTTE
jgi:hypothetical protein